MSVYVDNAHHKFGRMHMCHMIADTSEELLAMADKIGVQKRWLQNLGTNREHFDISAGKRMLAVAHGAREIGNAKLGKMLLARAAWISAEGLDAETSTRLENYDRQLAELGKA